MAISVFVCSLLIGVRAAGWLQFLELTAYDYHIRLLSSGEVSPKDSPIVLIKVLEEDIRRHGHWPISDRTLASLLKALSGYKPRAIGLDIYRDIPVPPGSKELTDAFSTMQNVVTVKKMGDGQSVSIPQPYMVKNTDMVGFNDIIVDSGGIVRRGLLFIDDGRTTSYSFSLILAMLYLEKEGIVPQADERNEQYFRLGKTTHIPFESNDGGYVRADARGYQFLLDYSGYKTRFPAFSLTDALGGKIPEDAIKDKIVIIGVTAESLKDFFYTPFSRGDESEQKMHGVKLHGHIADQLIKSALHGSTQKKYFSEMNEWLWIFLWGLAGGILGALGRSFGRSLLFGIISLSFLVLVTYYAFRSGWWIPVVPPAMAWVLSNAGVTTYNAFREKKDRALLMHLFSRHVSPDVAKAIWQDREQFMDGNRPRSQKLTSTILFTDLKGFTSVSEKLEPQTLMDWLNEYMEAMAAIVIEHSGVINKYIGDSIMAIFGVPVARTEESSISNDAVNAVKCALAMSGRLDMLNATWKERGLPTVKMRIGIYTGTLIAGSLGSAERMEYTVIGDTVNIASRLESFDKDFELMGKEAGDITCRILIGEETLTRLGGRFVTRKVGEVALKGKESKISIYIVDKLLEDIRKET
jgi:adenylate cyclase